MAKYLPANSTLFFFDLKTDGRRPEWQYLQQIFADITSVELFDLETLGFSEPDQFIALTGERAGIAFFGDEFDPRSFLLVLDVADRVMMSDYLAYQALSGEELKREFYLGVQTYTYPRSREQAFAFVGGDLLFATDIKVLRQALAAYQGHAERISETAGYRAVQSNLNSKAVGFGYFTEGAVRQLLLARLGGLRSALMVSLLELWSAGGVELTADQAGVRLTAYIATAPQHAREPLFSNLPDYRSDLLSLLGEEVVSFYAIQDLAGQVEHLLATSEDLHPALTLLGRGFLDTSAKQLFGTALNWQETLVPLLTGDLLIGRTKTGGLFFGLTGKNIETNFAKFKFGWLIGNGILTARKQTLILPDGTQGQVLKSDPALIKEENFEIAGLSAKRLIFPNQTRLNYVSLEGKIIGATEEGTLIAMLDRLAVGETGEFAELTEELGGAEDYIYHRLAENTADATAFLRPFRYLLVGKQTDLSGIKLKFLFGK